MNTIGLVYSSNTGNTKALAETFKSTIKNIEYNVEGHLARITLNRPESFNSFSDEMIDLWAEALEDVRDRDDIYTILLTGKGRGFCSGGDVKAMVKSHRTWPLGGRACGRSPGS